MHWGTCVGTWARCSYACLHACTLAWVFEMRRAFVPGATPDSPAPCKHQSMYSIPTFTYLIRYIHMYLNLPDRRAGTSMIVGVKVPRSAQTMMKGALPWLDLVPGPSGVLVCLLPVCLLLVHLPRPDTGVWDVALEAPHQMHRILQEHPWKRARAPLSLAVRSSGGSGNGWPHRQLSPRKPAAAMPEAPSITTRTRSSVWGGGELALVLLVRVWL